MEVHDTERVRGRTISSLSVSLLSPDTPHRGLLSVSLSLSISLCLSISLASLTLFIS